jgi:hypothetical protein
MQLGDLKKYFRSGVIESAQVLPVGNCWVVECKMLNGNKERLVKARSTNTKQYKSISGAISDVKNAGFDRVEVLLEET